MKIKNYLPAIILYLISTGISFAAFKYLEKPFVTQAPPPRTEEGGLQIDPNEPRTEACPLNGQLFTKTERRAWEVRRPLAVMIENHEEARPQSGLIEADVVYETIAEGGITRFMGLFYCDAIAKDTLLAPVRSARTYFLDWASEYGEYPLYIHVGGANCSQDAVSGACKTDKRVQALEQIERYGWGGRTGNDINQFSVGYPTFYRDYNRLDHQVATEHTMVSSTEKLWALAADRGWTNLSPEGEDWVDAFVPWEFLDEDEQNDGGSSATNISFDFWDGFGQYAVKWDYDSSNRQYLRSNGGRPHNDHETDQQLNAKNVIILFTKETGPVDDLKHMLYDTVGKGDALIFQNGQVFKVNWSKASRTARTLFTDSGGDDFKFVPGRIWLEIVDTSTEIDY